jgi:RNA ligase
VVRHPVDSLPFRELLERLRRENEEGRVFVKRLGDMSLWCYTRETMWDNTWNETNVLARGLVLCEKEERILARPFPKIFNAVLGDEFPTGEFVAREKLDGSLIIVFHDGREWRSVSKGSFSSDVVHLSRHLVDDLRNLVPGRTYLMEYVGPDNRIVLEYEKEELVLLGCYGSDGEDLSDSIDEMAPEIGVRHAPRLPGWWGKEQVLEYVAGLGADHEGVVIRFKDTGERLKVKGAQYLNLHKCISDVSPLSVWAAMRDGNYPEFEKSVPEEFRKDIVRIHDLLERRIDDLIVQSRKVNRDLSHVPIESLAYAGIKKDLLPLVFADRNGKNPMISRRTRRFMFQFVRPTGNRLDGYNCSDRLHRFEMENE